jgi:predicted oxidoreductase
METIQLGKSDLNASRIAYGCWRITGNPETAGISTEREENARRSIIAAYEAGYTLFDQADVYAEGESERVFGKIIQEVSGMRDRILIATKCGIRKPGDPDSDAPYRYDFSAEHIQRACNQSLQRMKIETIDLFQLHRPDYLSNPHEVADAFVRLKESGKVRHFGVSNFKPSQLNLLQKACPFPLIVNQVEISLSKLEAFTDGTLDQCMCEDITPMAWAPLAGGRLGATDPIDLRLPDHAHRIQLRETLDIIARLYDLTRSVVAVSWLLKHPSNIVPIIGATQPEKIKDLTQATLLHLTREEWYRILEAAYGRRLP